MKKILLLGSLVSASFAHLHDHNHGGLMADIMHIVSQPDHIAMVVGVSVLTFAIAKYKKVKSKKA